MFIDIQWNLKCYQPEYMWDKETKMKLHQGDNFQNSNRYTHSYIIITLNL